MKKIEEKSRVEPVVREALKRAEEVMKNSYSPYNDFAVGACLYDESGIFVTGTNFENVAADAIHAEEDAIGNANKKGLRKFRGIVVISHADELSGPCGGCRQFILELAEINDNPQFKVITASTKLDYVKIETIEELLPSSFSPSKLGVDPTEYQ